MDGKIGKWMIWVVQHSSAGVLEIVQEIESKIQVGAWKEKLLIWVKIAEHPHIFGFEFCHRRQCDPSMLFSYKCGSLVIFFWQHCSQKGAFVMPKRMKGQLLLLFYQILAWYLPLLFHVFFSTEFVSIKMKGEMTSPCPWVRIHRADLLILI